MKERTCTKCRIEKPLDEFYKSKEGRFGVTSMCKSCYIKATRKWTESNPEKAKKRLQEWRKKNPEKIYARAKKWKIANPEKVKAKDNLYRKTHKKERNMHIRQRRKKDSKFKLNGNISSLIRQSLKGNKNGRHWEIVIGYTLDKLKKHLEKLFVDGMTWDNYGKNGWTIDHKIPISVFNFTQPEHEDFKRCWALNNLQPMWEKDNMIKKAKLTEHFQPRLEL